MVTSDHGEHLGEHGLADHHAALCEHLTRVPFVAWGPGLVPSGVRGRLYELVDVFPSIVRMLGEQPPAGHLAGRRDDLFAPEAKAFGEEYAVTEWKAWVDKERDRLAARNPSFDFTGLARDLVAVRDRRFKLVREPDGDRLYDLPADPMEDHDLGRSRPETSRRLRERLDGAIESWRTWDEAGAAEVTPRSARRSSSASRSSGTSRQRSSSGPAGRWRAIGSARGDAPRSVSQLQRLPHRRGCARRPRRRRRGVVLPPRRRRAER